MYPLMFATGSTNDNSLCIASHPCSVAFFSISARTSGLALGKGDRPSSNALKYSIVPPTNSGIRPATVISSIAFNASRRKSLC